MECTSFLIYHANKKSQILRNGSLVWMDHGKTYTISVLFKNMTTEKIKKFFERWGIKIRGKLSHYPILYAFLGGVGIVLFWRGVWHTADDINLGSIVSLIIGFLLLLIIGVFVAEFIGNKLIISGLVGEKKIATTEEGEIETEETQLKNLQNTLNRVEKKLSDLEVEVEKK
jgi:hypothetical protein